MVYISAEWRLYSLRSSIKILLPLKKTKPASDRIVAGKIISFLPIFGTELEKLGMAGLFLLILIGYNFINI